MSWSFENLSKAPMPTASTAQILGNNESFEPYTWPSSNAVKQKSDAKPASLRELLSKVWSIFRSCSGCLLMCRWSCFWLDFFLDIQGRTSMFVVSSLVNLFRRGVSGGSGSGVVAVVLDETLEFDCEVNRHLLKDLISQGLWTEEWSGEIHGTYPYQLLKEGWGKTPMLSHFEFCWSKKTHQFQIRTIQYFWGTLRIPNWHPPKCHCCS